MIRPRLVPYTDEWHERLQIFAETVGWPPEMQQARWNPYTTLLAIHRDRVVGFVAGWAGQPVGIIDLLVVLPDVSGQGVGVFLWVAMTRRLFALGALRVRFLTANRSLQRMLERCGYTVLSDGVMMEGCDARNV